MKRDLKWGGGKQEKKRTKEEVSECKVSFFCQGKSQAQQEERIAYTLKNYVWAYVYTYINLKEEDQECEAGQKSEVRRENATKKKNPQRSESAKKFLHVWYLKIKYNTEAQSKARHEKKNTERKM